MFSSVSFVLVVLVCYVVLTSIPSGLIVNVFGVLNLFAIWLLFGWKSAVVISSLTGVLWLCLFLVKLTGLQQHKNTFVRTTVFFSLLVPILSLIFLSDIANIWVRADEGQTDTLISYFLVIGLSYFGLRMWDCMFSVMDGQPLANPIALFGYLMPFHMVFAGPIASYKDHMNSTQHASNNASFKHFLDCLLLISFGYAMKFFFAEFYKLSITGTDTTWELITVFDTWIYLVYIFLEFWGYSLIALGVGRLIGISTPINFNHPYLSTSVGEFWTRWHMSLGAFGARTIYNPIMLFFIRRFGSQNKKSLFVWNIIALWCPFIFIGLWHHISWSFFVWGLVVGFVVAAEKAAFELLWVKTLVRRRKSRMAHFSRKIFGAFYTQITVAATLTLAIKEFTGT